MVRLRFALHLGHLTAQLSARIAPRKTNPPTAGASPCGTPGRSLLAAVPTASTSQPMTAAAVHHHIRRLMYSRIVMLRCADASGCRERPPYAASHESGHLAPVSRQPGGLG